MSRLAACFALLLLLPGGSAAAAALGLELNVEASTNGEWRLSYTLSRPVSALVFLRGGGDYRRDTWVPADGFVVERFGQTDRIRRVDDRPFDVLSARVTPYTSRLEKDYTPYIRFSDGAMAMFTGQFTVGEALRTEAEAFIDGARDSNTWFPDSAVIRMAPAGFGQMIVNAEIVSEPTAVALGEGEYVYFGQATAVDTPTLVAVTDSAAPAWLRDFLFESMAATYAYFTERLGPLPGGKPFMLASFESLEGRHVSFSGGVIGPQLAIELGLGSEVANTADNRRFMARFFAHESAHLWNNHRTTPADNAESWMHEGSAEAFAWLALTDLGILEPEGVRSLFEEAANDCVTSLAEGPLREARRRGSYAAYYNCGATIAFATHSLMVQRDRDLFDFWRELIEISETGDGTYTGAAYAALVREIAPGFDDRLLRFTDTALDDPDAAVRELLLAAGVVTGRGDDQRILIRSPGTAITSNQLRRSGSAWRFSLR